jgi:lipopolysaccharide assembly outer membrane protein LptD (OstA)
MSKKLNFYFFVLFQILIYSCHHIDDTKFLNIYNTNVSKEIDNAKARQGEKNSNITEGKKVLEQAKKVETKSEKKKKKNFKIRELNIKSDSMVFNRETAEVIFEKNVRIFAEDISLFADKLVSDDYKKEANAEGNVTAYYKKNNLKVTSKRMKYEDNFNKIIAYDNVIVQKILEDGNTLNVYADEIEFDSINEIITAIKKNKRIKVKIKDITAYADKITYNEDNKELCMEGKPVVKKKSSFFLSERIVFDVNKKTIKLSGNIWSKLYYEEFEKTSKEIKK